MWVAPEIKDPVQLHASTRKAMACFGAARLNDGQFVWSTSPKFNAQMFERFLRRLLRHRRRGKRMVVVLDNAVITTPVNCVRSCSASGTS